MSSNEKATPPCYPYYVPYSDLYEYDVPLEEPIGGCPSGQTLYARLMPPQPGKVGTPDLKCMPPSLAKDDNEKYCAYAESFEEPKMADQNSKCDGNNFIESETGYRQATQCVCAPYKSSHIHFVT